MAKVYYKKASSDKFKDIPVGSCIRYMDRKTGKITSGEVCSFLYIEESIKLVVTKGGEKDSIYSDCHEFVWIQTNNKKDVKEEEADAELQKKHVEYLTREVEKHKKNFVLIKNLLTKLAKKDGVYDAISE